MTHLYYIDTKSICRPDEDWLRQAYQQYACAECDAIDPAVRKRGVDVHLDRMPDLAAVNACQPPRINIARRGFLELFRAEVEQYLHLGRVVSPGGAVMDNYVTFTSQRPLLLRGDSRAYYRTCPACGRFIYVPLGEWWVDRKSLTGQPLYECDFGGLFMTCELRTRIERGRWKGINIMKVPVQDEPLDGLTAIPDNYYYRGTGPCTA